MDLKYELSLSSAKRSEADMIPRSLLRGEFIAQNNQGISVVNPAKAGPPSLNMNKNEYFSKVFLFSCTGLNIS